MKLTAKTVVLLVSSSRFLLEGISNVIEIKNDNIEILTKASNDKIEEFIAQTNPQFIFIDNRTTELDIKELLDLICRTNPDTKIILFKNESGVKEYDSSTVVLITNETNSFELLGIIKNEGLGKCKGSGIDNFSC